MSVSLLSIGTSALSSYKDALNTVGNNIANANTEGYTRQRVEFGTNPSQEFGSGLYQGTGVNTDAIRRVTNGFLVEQLRRDTALSSSLDTLKTNLEELDGLLANEETGLAPALNDFFLSLQGAADDPTSVPMRQLVLAQADTLANRMDVLYERMADIEKNITDQLRDGAEQVTVLAEGIATLNAQIARSQSANNSVPNDLLDQRDRLLNRLSEAVSVTTSLQDDGAQLNVFIGNGQPLVLGDTANSLAVTNSVVPELELVTPGARLGISDSISGGQLGGLLDFRRQGLDFALNSMGRVAMTLTRAVNDVHATGVDLQGRRGEDVFLDITREDLVGDRVQGLPGNSLPDDRQMNVVIDDPAALTLSDYQLEFPGPGDREFVLRRKSDDAVLVNRQLTGAFPESLSVDGFTLNIEAGTFEQGDTFVLRPSRYGARDFALRLSTPESLALAAPLRSDANLGNQGTGAVTDISVLDIDHPSFATERAVEPPLLIRFTSPTRYEVLDNSVPGQPQSLSPPLENLGFIPGVPNTLLPEDPDATIVVGDGSALGRLPAAASTRATPGTLPNGYPAETLTIDYADPDTLQPLGSVPIAIGPNQSAASIRDQLSALDGVSATATTTVALRNLVDAGAGPMNIHINGIDLTDPADGPVQQPLDLDWLTQRINTLPAFEGQGLSARREGDQLVIEARDGRDLTIDIAGDPADGLELVDAQGGSLALAGTGPGSVQGASVGGVVTVNLDPGARLTGDAGAGLFSVSPTALPGFLGYQVTISGEPQAGDSFTIDFNTDGTGDNRNALRLSGLQTANLLDSDTASLNDSYAQLVETVGADAARARTEADTGAALQARAQASLDAVAGVSLDEEAADLIRFEQAYGAATRVISVARTLFDTLLNSI